MTAGDLMQKLAALPPEVEVFAFDGFDGHGDPVYLPALAMCTPERVWIEAE